MSNEQIIVSIVMLGLLGLCILGLILVHVFGEKDDYKRYRNSPPDDPCM